MKPPPPMFPALGCVTASANAVATAASTALPPFARIAAPASQAGDEVHTTSPSFDATPSSSGALASGASEMTARTTLNAANLFSMATAYLSPAAAPRVSAGRKAGGRRAEAGHRSCESSAGMDIWPGEAFPLGATFDGE